MLLVGFKGAQLSEELLRRRYEAGEFVIGIGRALCRDGLTDGVPALWHSEPLTAAECKPLFSRNIARTRLARLCVPESLSE
jgi:hypothetical protein